MKDKNFFLHDRLNEAQVSKFKLFEDEDLIFACREHWLPITLRLIRQFVVGITLSSMAGVTVYILLHSIALGISSFLFLVFVVGGVSVRDLIHWSFHLYIATTKQIIEVHYSPLFSHVVNSVLLDQIRCTEIDVEMHGLIPELIGIGNVELTFDRPTHKEEFIIKGVRSPRKIANLLSAQLHQGTASLRIKSQGPVLQPLWVKELKKNRYRFLGETNYGATVN